MLPRSYASPPFATWLRPSPIILLCLLLCASFTTGMTLRGNDVAKGDAAGLQHVFAEDVVNDYDDDMNTQIRPTPCESLSLKQFDTISEMADALDVLQEQYFEIWQGLWPTGIDWTSAVLGTLISGSLSTLSTSVDYVIKPKMVFQMTEKAQENLINRYFSQLIASYFGQDAFRLRNEAYDDMLWVVLGWLESIKFVRLHSNQHYKEPQRPLENDQTQHSSWHGKQWIPTFAHRARLFWDLASKGWDTSLCDGGMIWSPYLTPYKNAITNELFITASISMYLYFPGDDNTSPFKSHDGPPVGPHDPRYLAAAIEGYKWLNLSNMTNTQGLYVDGFHIGGWERKPGNGTEKPTKCDDRNNMVYTYNQGVLLSGQRGLWEATGARSYLEEGHKLVSNVVNATGYDLKHDKLFDDEKYKHLGQNLSEWRGIGRRGIMEDVCDAHGYCSQDAQTFKGIFFHHLTTFCAPLPPQLFESRDILDLRSFQDIQSWHQEKCSGYGGWIRLNAKAAMATRNDDGKYGMWWGAPKGNVSKALYPKSDLPDRSVDYRNEGIPKDLIWRDSVLLRAGLQHALSDLGAATAEVLDMKCVGPKDANDRGRGRTVETQAGGLAVLRALWEIIDLPAMQRKTYVS